MSPDEAQIRSLVQEWHATQAGDTARVLDLMTEDVVFLVPGRPPMGKAEFAALSTPAPGVARPQIAAAQEIHEIEIVGTLAFMRSSLTITLAPPGGGEAVERSGSTLTVFRKAEGRWLLARDANLLVVREQRSPA